MESPTASDEAFARVVKENEILRNIIRRQLQDREKRDAAGELLKDELARLQLQSPKVDEQLLILASTDARLSDEERALFKDLPTVAANPPADQPANVAAKAPTLKTGDASDLPSASEPASGSDTAIAPDLAATPSTAPGVPQADAVLSLPVAAGSVALAREAKENFDKGRYAEAGKAYDLLLAREPKNVYLMASQALVFLRRGNIKEAEALGRKAAGISPKDSLPHATLGIVFFKMGRYDEAIAALMQAIQLDPKNAMAHNYLGITSSQKGWPEAAIDEVQKAIALNPNYAEAHFNMAVIYATSQPPARDRAEEHYKIATSLGTPPDPALEKLIKN